MKRTAVLFAAGLVTLLAERPAIAADPTGTPGSTSSDRMGAIAPAEKPSMRSTPPHVTGSVVSVDQMTRRVSIKAAPKDDCCAGGIA